MQIRLFRDADYQGNDLPSYNAGVTIIDGGAEPHVEKPVTFSGATEPDDTFIDFDDFDEEDDFLVDAVYEENDSDRYYDDSDVSYPLGVRIAVGVLFILLSVVIYFGITGK